MRRWFSPSVGCTAPPLVAESGVAAAVVVPIVVVVVVVAVVVDDMAKVRVRASVSVCVWI